MSGGEFLLDVCQRSWAACTLGYKDRTSKYAVCLPQKTRCVAPQLPLPLIPRPFRPSFARSHRTRHRASSHRHNVKQSSPPAVFVGVCDRLPHLPRRINCGHGLRLGTFPHQRPRRFRSLRSGWKTSCSLLTVFQWVTLK